jgi:glycosyltransferase involved in cell wall biosynthesis
LDKKIKILTLSDHPLHPSGVAHMTKLMIEAMLKTGKYQFISLGGAIKHPDYRPIKVEEFGEDWLIFPVDGYGTQEQIRSILRNHKPDILWFMTDPRYYHWLWEIEDEVRTNVPMVYYHVWDNFPAPTYNEPMYSSNDVIVTISKVTDEIVKTVSPNVERHYLPHAVNTDVFKKYPDFDPKTFKREHLKDENKFLFFWNNRNARRKQSGSLIFWFKSFLDRVGHDKATLLMHTEVKDPHGQDLLAIINHLGLTNGEVIFSEKKMPAQDLAMIYNAADAVVSISDAEGFGLSIVEAKSCETPVIVTKTGGMSQQVYDDDGNELGYGIEPCSKAIIGSQQIPFIYEDRTSEKDVVKALETVYSMTQEEREKIGKLARADVMKNYSYDYYCEKWDEILQSVYDNHGSWETRKGYNPWEIKEL